MHVPAQADVLSSHDPQINHQQATSLHLEQTHILSEVEDDEDHTHQVALWKKLVWWKRPSPYWILFGIPFTSFGYSALLAPKVALYTSLACRVHKPQLVTNNSLSPLFSSLENNLVTTNGSDFPIPRISAGQATASVISILLPNTTYLPSGHSKSEPDPQQKCASDPLVQATVAKLTAVFTTCIGILACLTTGWWGSLSDRYGRRIVLFTSIFGLFANDAIHIITAWFVDVLPGGYWFPLVGSLIDGLCGSMPTALAMSTSYLADTTEPSTRSRYFSLSHGFMFAGVAVGPAFGGLLIHFTGNLLSNFYFACILHGLYSFSILFVFPESLTRARARDARLRRNQERANQVSGNRVLHAWKSCIQFFSPLAVFLPEELSDDIRKRRDWSLLLIAIAYGLNTSVLGTLFYRYQYAAAQFYWTPEIMNYFVSWIGVTRAIFLVVILPVLLKYLKPAPVQLPATDQEPLQGGQSLPDSDPTRIGASERQHLMTSRSPTQFDLALARTSAVLDATASLGMATANTGVLFTTAATIASLGAGFMPALQALALDVYTSHRTGNRGEVGKLLGALSMIQALTSQILSPALYGLVYANTVAVFPRAIMVVWACTSLLVVVFTSLVRVRVPSGSCDSGEDADE